MQEPKDGIQYCMAASLLYDTAMVCIRESKEMQVTMLAPQGVERYLGSSIANISLPHETPEEIVGLIRRGQFGLSYAIPNDTAMCELLMRLAPLVEEGHLLVRPERLIVYVSAQHDNGSRTWSALDIASSSPFDTWTVDNKRPESPIQIQAGDIDTPGNRMIATVLIPFISGISTKDFIRVMHDERDLIVEFRAALRQVVREAKSNGVTAQEIVSDVLLPKVSKIERQFHKIVTMNRLNLGGAVLSTLAMSLTAFLATGLTAAISVGVGAGGLALVGRELASRQGDLATLKDDASYLLWRLRRNVK